MTAFYVPSSVRLVLVLVLLSIANTPLASAQSNDFPPATRVLSVNPILLLGGWLTGEFEQAAWRAWSFGARLSFVAAGIDFGGNEDRSNYVSGRAFFRVYDVVALKGSYGGASVGMTGWSEQLKGWRSFLGVGLEGGHNWLVHPAPAVLVSLGGGFDQLFGSADNYLVPMVRFNVGMMF